MNRAVEVAQQSTARSQQHGALVVRNGNILSFGFNKDSNHPDVMDDDHAKFGASCHAEVAALKKVKNPRGCTVVVARWAKSKRVALSRPCRRCEDYMLAVGVRKVIHT